MSFENKVTMAMDAMCHSSRTILSRVFDDVQVTVDREARSDWAWGRYRDVVVHVQCTHRNREMHQVQHLPPEMVADENFYCDYLRTEMPRRIAHEFTEFLLRK